MNTLDRPGAAGTGADYVQDAIKPYFAKATLHGDETRPGKHSNSANKSDELRDSIVPNFQHESKEKRVRCIIYHIFKIGRKSQLRCTGVIEFPIFLQSILFYLQFGTVSAPRGRPARPTLPTCPSERFIASRCFCFLIFDV